MTPREQRRDRRVAESQWRTTRRVIVAARAPIIATALAAIGEWVADHFPFVCVAALGSAFLAGCMTGAVL